MSQKNPAKIKIILDFYFYPLYVTSQQSDAAVAQW